MTRPTRISSRTLPRLRSGALGYAPGVVTENPEPPTDRASAAAGGRAYIPFLPPDESGALVDLNLEFGTVTNDGRNTHNYDTPANVNDGNEGNPPAFANSGVDSGVRRGLESDLGSAREVHKMRIRADRSGTTAQADYVESSPDGSTWSAVAGSWASSGSDRIFTFAAPETERYFAAGFLDTPFAFFPWIDWFTWTIEGPQDTPPESVLWIDAPLTIDGSSSTYEEVFEDTVTATTGPFWRGTLDDTYLIARFAAEIGFENAGSVTVLVQAGNEADYSDATTIDTLTVTATGSFTPDDLAASWVPTAVYRYWQLVLDTTAQSVQVVEVHLFDPTNGELIGVITDHGDLDGLADDDHPQYGLINEGGGDDKHELGTLGATESIDPTNGNVQRGTLDQDCAITLLPPATGRVGSVSTIELYVVENGTGGWTPTFDASGGTIVWPGGSPPTHVTTANSVTRYLFETLDDGVTWYGTVVGGSGGGVVGELDDLTDVVITSPATAERLRYDGSVWRNSSLKWVPVTVSDGTNYFPLVDGAGNAVMTEA